MKLLLLPKTTTYDGLNLTLDHAEAGVTVISTLFSPSPQLEDL